MNWRPEDSEFNSNKSDESKSWEEVLVRVGIQIYFSIFIQVRLSEHACYFH